MTASTPSVYTRLVASALRPISSSRAADGQPCRGIVAMPDREVLTHDVLNAGTAGRQHA
jgi:hypothetical protein